MPVMTKKAQAKYEAELRERFEILVGVLSGRDLKSPREGAGQGSWIDASDMCATAGTAMEIRLAVEDFKGILGEIKKLK